MQQKVRERDGAYRTAASFLGTFVSASPYGRSPTSKSAKELSLIDEECD
jgi:hypothetical protein